MLNGIYGVDIGQFGQFQADKYFAVLRGISKDTELLGPLFYIIHLPEIVPSSEARRAYLLTNDSRLPHWNRLRRMDVLFFSAVNGLSNVNRILSPS